MTMHPYLLDSERARAYAMLLASPMGSSRRWASAIGWTQARFHRFMQGLTRYRLGEFTASAFGTTFRPSPTSDSGPIQGRVTADSEPIQSRFTLGSSRLLGKEPSDAGSEYSTALITAMNDALSARFLESYRRILTDNTSSLEAATFLDIAGVPKDKAVAHLEEQCRLFNPSKHGKGALPRSLAYFKRGILKAWQSEGQIEIPLVSVETVGPARPVYGARKQESDIRPAARGETIDAGLEEFHRVAASKTKPQRMA